MKSKEFTWNKKNSHEIKRIHMKSKGFKWNQKNSHEIKRIQMKSMMNSQEHKWIQMKYARISEKCESIGTFWEKCY